MLKNTSNLPELYTARLSSQRFTNAMSERNDEQTDTMHLYMAGGLRNKLITHRL